MDEGIQRKGTASLVYSLEMSLGRITREKNINANDVPSSLVSTIRTLAKNELPEHPSIDQLLEGSYLSEAFELAKFATVGTEQGKSIDDLKRWCEGSGFFSLRNVIAHPNRRWISHYWHLCQAMATHPSVFSGQLVEVVEDHKAVLNGTIKPPPDSWIMALREFEVPNNLEVVRRQQGLTGFFGRKQEKAKLRKLLMHPKSQNICLVGQGGLGKTALVVDMLQELSRDAASARELKKILLVTGKVCMTTMWGSKPIRADFSTAEEIGAAIAQALLGSQDASLDEAKKVYLDEQIILCLDNLEGVLLENPEIIDELLLGLPERWKVIVTSRIPINMGYTMKLDRLSPVDAKALAIGHSRELGIEQPIENDGLEMLVGKAETPLAIRVALQGVAGGLDLTASLAKATVLTSENAYSQLLEALPAEAKELLDTMQGIGEPISCANLAHVIKWDLPQVQENIALLNRFNLLARGGREDETLLLRESLSEHLARVHLNLGARNRGHREWQEFKAAIQVVPDSQTGPVGDVTDQMLRIALLKVINDSEDDDKWPSLATNLDQLQAAYPDCGAIHRVRASLFKSQGDEAGRLRELGIAVEMDSLDWRASMELGEIYLNYNRYDDVLSIVIPCTQHYCGSNSSLGRRDRQALLRLYYKANIWKASDRIKEGDIQNGTNLLEAVVAETADWQSRDDLTACRAWSHGIALRRFAESPNWQSNPVGKNQILLQAIQVYIDLFKTEGQQPFLLFEIADLINEICYSSIFLQLKPDSPLSQAVFQFFFENFSHLKSMTPAHHAAGLEKLQRSVENLLDANVLPEEARSLFKRPASHPAENQYVVAAVYGYSPGRPYVFARGSCGTQYYVSKRSLADPSDNLDLWVLGTEITGVPMGAQLNNRAIPLADVSRLV